MSSTGLISPRNYRFYRPQHLSIRDFSGGVNLRDAQPELALNEEPDAWNVTFDERGGASARLGYLKVNGSAYGGGVVKNVWYSPTLVDYVTQAGASLYLGTGTTARKTFTTNARVGFADFAGKLCVMHPVDGLFTTTDGITYTAVADVDAPKGDALYVWQNKLFSNVVASPRVAWSAAGDPTNWAPTDFVDLREKDSERVVGFAGASGTDIAIGKAGLICFKRRSAYRIYDSASGAFVTIDQQIGAASALAAVTWNGRIYTINEYGLHFTDGFSPMTPVAQRFEPLWTAEQLALNQLDLWCAGLRRNRLHFSLCRAGSSANDLALELHPQQGWIAPGSNAMSCYTNFANATSKLYGGSPTVSGQVYELYRGGADDGAAIASRLQLRWFELADGFQFNVWRARFRGKGTPHVEFRKDYETGATISYDLALTDTSQLLYDTGLLYDSGLQYQTPLAEAQQDVFPPLTAEALSLVITASTSTSDNLPALLGVGTGPEVGGWRLYAIDFEFISMAYR